MVRGVQDFLKRHPEGTRVRWSYHAGTEMHSLTFRAVDGSELSCQVATEELGGLVEMVPALASTTLGMLPCSHSELRGFVDGIESTVRGPVDAPLSPPPHRTVRIGGVAGGKQKAGRDYFRKIDPSSGGRVRVLEAFVPVDAPPVIPYRNCPTVTVKVPVLPDTPLSEEDVSKLRDFFDKPATGERWEIISDDDPRAASKIPTPQAESLDDAHRGLGLAPNGERLWWNDKISGDGPPIEFEDAPPTGHKIELGPGRFAWSEPYPTGGYKIDLLPISATEEELVKAEQLADEVRGRIADEMLTTQQLANESLLAGFNPPSKPMRKCEPHAEEANLFRVHLETKDARAALRSMGEAARAASKAMESAEKDLMIYGMHAEEAIRDEEGLRDVQRVDPQTLRRKPSKSPRPRRWWWAAIVGLITAVVVVVSGLNDGLGLYDRWKRGGAPSHRLGDVVRPYLDSVSCKSERGLEAGRCWEVCQQGDGSSNERMVIEHRCGPDA
jgi:hypothetical protein